jgi:hypothetical protein
MNKPLFEDDAQWNSNQNFYAGLISDSSIGELSPNFKEALTLGIAEALIKRPESLWQLLYRMDIAEKEVGAILASREQVPERIADLLIERVRLIRELRSKF